MKQFWVEFKAGFNAGFKASIKSNLKKLFGFGASFEQNPTEKGDPDWLDFVLQQGRGKAKKRRKFRVSSIKCGGSRLAAYSLLQRKARHIRRRRPPSAPHSYSRAGGSLSRPVFWAGTGCL
jgi:hypothetical protein